LKEYEMEENNDSNNDNNENNENNKKILEDNIKSEEKITEKNKLLEEINSGIKDETKDEILSDEPSKLDFKERILLIVKKWVASFKFVFIYAIQIYLLYVFQYTTSVGCANKGNPVGWYKLNFIKKAK
jgi:hypothetical protein